MSQSSDYYVYALLDPSESPARPFYVGKGHGDRKNQHLHSPEESAKWREIESIREGGTEPVVVELVSNLTEEQAFSLEAQLIGAFGTRGRGGLLTNQVRPSGMSRSRAKTLTMPWGAVERAQGGLSLLKQAVLDLVVANPGGVSNADVASSLGLRSHYMGASKDYLSYSLLGLLMNEGRIHKKGRRYLNADPRRDATDC